MESLHNSRQGIELSLSCSRHAIPTGLLLDQGMRAVSMMYSHSIPCSINSDRHNLDLQNHLYISDIDLDLRSLHFYVI